MKELWLKFKDEFGEPQRVRVAGENFVIGRSPNNDLSIARNQLSRTHAEINRFGNSYVISDCNSSNGTTLNGVELLNPAELKSGDRVNLGGGIEIEVELIDSGAYAFGAGAGGIGGAAAAQGFDDEDFSAPPPPASVSAAAGGIGGGGIGDFAPDASSAAAAVPGVEGGAADPAAAIVAAGAAPAAPAVAKPAVPAKPGGSIFKSFFIIAPVLVIVFLLFVGLLLLIFGGGRKKTAAADDGNDSGYIGSTGSGNKRGGRRAGGGDDPGEDETPTPRASATPTPSNSGSNPPANAGSSPTPSSTSSPSSPPLSGELDVLERNAVPFMRRIAAGEDNYAFTRPQLGEINRHLKTFKGSAALKNNLKSVKRSSAQFEQMARTKGLKPQFLATAALARNPNQDPLATAQTMLPILGELRITLNNERADENLLIIAAYNFGEQEKYRALQTTLEALTNQSPGVPPSKIRTIWYLREKGKITDEQYNFALRFVAIGALMQNPRDFNVDAEAVTFN